MTRRFSVWSLPPLLLVVVVVVLLVAMWPDGDPAERSQAEIDVAASGAVLGSLEELEAASDRVVHVIVVDIEAGRAITDPDRPDVGVITQLVQLDVLGDAAASAGGITIEQEASLLDGTPITVNGARRLTVGDEGIAFLVAGATEEFPYFALVDRSAWVPVVEGVIDPDLDGAHPAARWAGVTPDRALVTLVEP